MKTEELTDWFTTQWDDSTTFPFVEDENCNITGYGHQDKAMFAAEVNRYDEVCNGEPWPEGDEWTADYIGHRWAVMDPDGDRFWVNVPASDERVEHLLPPGIVTAATPGAFPITTLWGQR